MDKEKKSKRITLGVSWLTHKNKIKIKIRIWGKKWEKQ